MAIAATNPTVITTAKSRSIGLNGCDVLSPVFMIIPTIKLRLKLNVRTFSYRSIFNYEKECTFCRRVIHAIATLSGRFINGESTVQMLSFTEY